MAKAITLNGATFSKLADAKQHLQSRMRGYEIGTPIPDEDVPLWAEVLERHEWYGEYVEHGIAYYSVAWSEQNPNLRNMVIVNDQGEQKPFSYLKYLAKGPLSKVAKVKAALRTEIEQQIADHRAWAFATGKAQCAITGATLVEGRSHVHHSGKPFLQIVDEFLKANAHRWDNMETEAAGTTGYRLRDRAIAADWQKFHSEHAKLEIVSPKANLQAGSAGYRMTFSPASL